MANKTLVGGTTYEVGGGKTLIGGTTYSIEGGKTLIGNTAYDVVFGGRVVNGEIKDSWEKISSAKYLAKYSLGNWKPITLSTGETIIMEIVAIQGDTKSDKSKANITWVSRGIVTERSMNSSGNVGKDWVGCDLRNWLQNDFYQTLPNDVKDAIVTVNKTYLSHMDTNGTYTCSDSIWIPSIREITGGGGETSGVKYTDYFSNADARIKYDVNGVAVDWWLRSTAQKNTSNSIYFYTIKETGTWGGWISTNTSGVVIGFCT